MTRIWISISDLDPNAWHGRTRRSNKLLSAWKHTDGQRIRRLLWIPSDGVHTAGESSKATVTCTEFVNQKRRSLTLQQLTQQPESGTLSRKRAPHRSKDPDETPRNDPIALKCSRPADPVQDPDPAENSVARPTGSAGAELLLTAAAAARDVEESTDEGVALATPGEATVLARTDQPENARQKKKRKQKSDYRVRFNHAMQESDSGSCVFFKTSN